MTLVVSALLLIAALLQVSISLMIFIGGSKPRPVYQKIFVCLATSILIFSLSSVILLFAATRLNSDNLLYFNIVNAIAFVDGTIVLLLMYLFSLYYPRVQRITTVKEFILGAGVALALISPIPGISGRFSYGTGGVTYQAGDFAILLAVFGLIVAVALVGGSLHLLRTTKDILLKQQMTSLLFALLLSVAHALLFVVVLPAIFGDKLGLYAIGYFAPIYFTGFVGYSLLKQNLFNVRLIVARSVAYILSLGIITLIFSLLIFGFSSTVLESHTSKLIQRIFYVLVILVLSLAFQPLKKFFDKLTNRIFYRDSYDPQVMLDDLNSGLVTTIELQKLIDIASKIISYNLKIQYCSFAIAHFDHAHNSYRLFGKLKNEISDETLEHLITALSQKAKRVIITDALKANSHALQNLLNSQNIMAVSRLDTHAGIIGYMLLGDRKSGGSYTSQDARIIEIVSDGLAIAIQNALRFEEIQQFNITLQQKVDEATGELRKVNSRLRQLDKTKDEFISMASHQLRTPLTTIKGYLSMVLEGDVGKISKEQQKMVHQAYDSAERMVFLIADLLNVSRLQSGKFVIENKPTDLAKMLETEVNQLQETAKNHHLTLTYKVGQNVPTLSLDETKIRQVVMNFLDNAIYYTPSGGSISADLAATDKEVSLTVNDTGLGVPASMQHHLFTKFYRADNARKMRPDGTGLGLFMAKKVIIAQGGAIIFKSTEGKGSTFGFSFPRSAVEAKSYVPEK